jgi:hypothetical protein
MKARTWDVNGVHFFVSENLIKIADTSTGSNIILRGATAAEYAVKDLRNAALWLETMLTQIKMEQK